MKLLLDSQNSMRAVTINCKLILPGLIVICQEMLATTSVYFEALRGKFFSGFPWNVERCNKLYLNTNFHPPNLLAPASIAILEKTMPTTIDCFDLMALPLRMDHICSIFIDKQPPHIYIRNPDAPAYVYGDHAQLWDYIHVNYIFWLWDHEFIHWENFC